LIKWAFKVYGKGQGLDEVVLSGIVKNPVAPREMVEAILKVDIDVVVTCAEGFL
jgi:hypothetical protein